MEPNFDGFGAKVKEGINVNQLIANGCQEFSFDADENLWENNEEAMKSTEESFDFEEVQKQINLDCIRCESEALDGSGLPFEQLRMNMTNLTPDGKVMKNVLRNGSIAIPEGSIVHLHYNAYVEMNEIPFDSSYLRSSRPVRHQMGVGLQLPGFEIAVLSMTVGEKSQFLVDPELAFGPLGVLERIPPNAVIMYVIEVFQITDCGKALQEESVDMEDRKCFARVFKKAKGLHALAGEYHRANNIYGAVDHYCKAENLIKGCSLANQEEEDQWKNLLFKIYTNTAVCFNHPKLKKPEKVCIAVRKAFEINPKAASTSPKLFYQRGCAHIAFGNYKAALSDLKKAKSLAPQDPMINEQLVKLNEKIARDTKMEKEFSAKAFGFKNLKITDDDDQIEDIDEETRAAVTAILEDFAKGPRSCVNLMSDYSASERAWLRKECNRLQLCFDDTCANGVRDVIISKK